MGVDAVDVDRETPGVVSVDVVAIVLVRTWSLLVSSPTEEVRWVRYVCFFPIFCQTAGLQPSLLPAAPIFRSFLHVLVSK